MKIFVSFDFDNDRQYKYTLNIKNTLCKGELPLQRVLHLRSGFQTVKDLILIL